MDISNKNIIDTVVHIYFRDNCSVDEAFDKAHRELGVKQIELVHILQKQMGSKT